jgi:hypothetical protein
LKNIAFCRQNAHVLDENGPLSGEIRLFLTSRFSRCGTKRAFSRTLKILPETEFHSVMTRAFFTFSASFSSLAA